MIEIDPLFKPLLISTVLVALWVFEWRQPMFNHSHHRVRHDVSNIALGVLNAVIAGFLFASLVFAVTTWSQVNEFGLLHRLAFNPWVELIIGLCLFDVWQYWWHRLNHTVPFLWRFHAVHHSDAAMNVSSAIRFHTVEILLSSLIRLAILPLIGLTLADLLIYELVLLPIILFHHSNIALPEWIDRSLRFFIVTPRIHWVHHSHLQYETDSNYASLLSVWDRIFGSFRLSDDPSKIRFGLGDRFDRSPYDQLQGMLKQPFDRSLNS